MADLQFMQPPKLNIQQLLQGAQPPEQDDGRLARIAQNIAQSRAAVEQPGEAQLAPAAPAPQVGPVQPPAALQAPAPQAQPSESSQLSAQLNKLNQPPSLKESIAKAGLAFAPTAIAGLVGGLPAAAGAAQGASAGLAAEDARQDQEKKSLLQQVEAARQREQQAGEFGQTLGFKREELGAENTRNANTIAAENQRAAGVQSGEDRRLQTTINNRPKPNIDPLSPEGLSAAVQRMREESQIPNRSTPRQPVPGVDSPLSETVEQQRIRIAKESKTEPQDQTAVQSVDDPDHPGRQMLVIVDKNKLTSTPVQGPSSKTTASQQNSTAKDKQAYEEAAKSVKAMQDLAKRRTYIADQAMGDQFFNVVKPGSGARMNEAQIERFMTPGPMKDRMVVWAQRLKQGQPFDDNARQAMIDAATDVLNSKRPPDSGSSGPKIGDVQDGYVFQGGNPSNPLSWRKQ